MITGAGGFLGSHIAHYFGDRGYVTAAVGRFAATPASSRIYPNLWKFCGMTLPDSRFADVVKEFQPALLVHCAGTASVAASVLEPYTDFQRTVEVCAFTLETIRRHSPSCRFILLSSASVYGNPESLPVCETAPLRPVSPYGYHKMLCETLTEEYASLHGLHSVILRIFSAYGERLHKQVVWDICQKILSLESEKIELSGTGHESRDFIHAADIARAIDCISATDAKGIFNVASGVQTTISELADMLSAMFKTSKKIVFNGMTRSGDPLRWQADISRLESLGFCGGITLQEGLRRYVEWFTSYRNGEP